jgi:hypothetical protein
LLRASLSSDAYLRKHLGDVHKMTEYMYKSQRKKYEKVKNDQTETVISKADKRLLNEATFDCIIMDSRPYKNFNKPGMAGFLSIASPGFKDLHRQ